MGKITVKKDNCRGDLLIIHEIPISENQRIKLRRSDLEDQIKHIARDLHIKTDVVKSDNIALSVASINKQFAANSDIFHELEMAHINFLAAVDKLSEEPKNVSKEGLECVQAILNSCKTSEKEMSPAFIITEEGVAKMYPATVAEMCKLYLEKYGTSKESKA